MFAEFNKRLHEHNMHSNSKVHWSTSLNHSPEANSSNIDIYCCTFKIRHCKIIARLLEYICMQCDDSGFGYTLPVLSQWFQKDSWWFTARQDRNQDLHWHWKTEDGSKAQSFFNPSLNTVKTLSFKLFPHTQYPQTDSALVTMFLWVILFYIKIVSFPPWFVNYFYSKLYLTDTIKMSSYLQAQRSGPASSCRVRTP